LSAACGGTHNFFVNPRCLTVHGLAHRGWRRPRASWLDR